MTLQDQLVGAGLVSEETRARLEMEEWSRDALYAALQSIHTRRCVDRDVLATMQPPELHEYHAELKRLRLYVIAVTKASVRFAQRPQRSYIAFCHAARRRFDREQARKARQQCVR